MLKIIIALLILFISNAQSSLGGYYKFKSDNRLVCRSDHYGTFLLQKRSSGSYLELKFNSTLISQKSMLAKLKREYSSLKKKKASSKILKAKKINIDKQNNIINEIKKCQAGAVKWLTKINFTTACTVLGGSALRTSGGVVAGERCLEGKSPTARIYITNSSGNGICSGTLVTPNIVVTAAHCTKGVDKIQVVIGRVERAVSSFTHHPSYDENAEDLENHDIGLIFLSQSITDVTPAQIYSGDNFIENETSIIGGYGVDRSGSAAGILRAGFMFLSGLGEGALYSRFAERTATESNTCFGDSGGPLYVLRDGSWKIAAVTSGEIFSSKPCLAPGISTFSRLGGTNTTFLQDNGVY